MIYHSNIPLVQHIFFFSRKLFRFVVRYPRNSSPSPTIINAYIYAIYKEIRVFLESTFFPQFMRRAGSKEDRIDATRRSGLFVGERAQTRRTQSRMFVWRSVNVAVCIVYRITALVLPPPPFPFLSPPPGVIRSLSILKELEARRYRSLKNTQGKLACWLYVQPVRVLVCKERRAASLEFPGCYIDSIEATFVTVGIIIPVKRCFHQLCNAGRPAPDPWLFFLKQTLSIKTTYVGSPLPSRIAIHYKYFILWKQSSPLLRPRRELSVSSK